MRIAACQSGRIGSAPAIAVDSLTSTRSCAAWKAGSRGISQRIASVGPAPTTSASGPFAFSRSVARAIRANAAVSSARYCIPASVRISPFARRTNSATPSRCSSSFTSRLIADGDTCSSPAAAT